jgi:AraC-like DNA-binding protein
MKLMFEKVLPTENSSWRYWIYQLEHIPFNWHYHPEYEIALTLNSKGQRYVGDNIENYEGVDLTLLGPNLPHTWCTLPNNNNEEQTVYVAQIPVAWLETLIFGMPDLAGLKPLLDLSKRGVTFSKNTSNACAKLFKQMKNDNPSKRFIALLQVLQLMLDDEEAKVLSSTGYNAGITSDPSTDKLDKIIRYLHQHYTENLKAEDLANLVHMSTNHFHRFIKQRTEQTFTELVNQLRISKACSLLINSQMPVTTVSDICGFNNISNFNRRFLQFKEMTPSKFRKVYVNQGSPA